MSKIHAKMGSKTSKSSVAVVKSPVCWNSSGNMVQIQLENSLRPGDHKVKSKDYLREIKT